MEVLVEYEYTAQHPDELSIKKGERIIKVVRKEEGWFEGELMSSGRRGLFPDNFVKPVKPGLIQKALGLNSKSPDNEKKKNFIQNTIGSVINNGKPSQPITKAQSPIPLTPQVPSKTVGQEYQFNARVLYTYVPVNEDELSIQENDIVQVIRLVEDGWFEGIYNGKRGVFPSNYVEKLVDTKSDSLTNENHMNSSLSLDESDLNRTKKPQTQQTQNQKKVLGIGFGNIFSGKQIELKTKDNFNLSPEPTHEEQDSIKLKRICKAKVIYDYEPTQPDELKLVTGELVYILDKNLDDEGWWKGESILTGKIGVFPDNFVKEIESDLNVAPQSAKRKGIINNPISIKQVTDNSTINHSSSSPTSTASSSSSNNSLQRENKKLEEQVIQNNNTKSQSDLSEDFEELSTNNNNDKLNNFKKIRQFNKRPPSFRNKIKNVQDEAHKEPEIAPIQIQSSSSSSPLPPPPQPQPPSATVIQPIVQSPQLNNQPQSPVNLNLIEDLNHLKQELELFKKNSSQLQSDYNKVLNDLNDVKVKHDDQMKKMQKKLNDLINEIDEEKKTRLALQVELERLKKTIMLNNN